jgi:hypothetical protein
MIHHLIVKIIPIMVIINVLNKSYKKHNLTIHIYLIEILLKIQMQRIIFRREKAKLKLL